MVRIERILEVSGFALFHALQIEYEGTLPPDLRHVLPAAAELPHVYADPNAAFLVTVEGEAAGCVAVAAIDSMTGDLRRLYVRPHYRRLGIARALVGAVVAFCTERGAERVVLHTEKARLSGAYDLYRSLQFVECSPYIAADYVMPTFMQRKISAGADRSSS